MGDVLFSQNTDLDADPSTGGSSQHVLVCKPSTGFGGGASGLGETSRSQGLTGQLQSLQVQCKKMFSVNKDRVIKTAVIKLWTHTHFLL